MTQFGGEKRHAVWSEKLKIKKGNFSRRFERNLEKLKDDFFTPFWAKFWKKKGRFSRRLKRKQARRFERKKHAVIAKFAGHGTVDFFCRFFFVSFDVFSRDGTDEDVVHHPAQDRMAIVSDFLLQSQLHQFFGRRRHILEAMIERTPP